MQVQKKGFQVAAETTDAPIYRQEHEREMVF